MAQKSGDVGSVLQRVDWPRLLSLLVSMGGSLYLLHKIMQQMDPTAATRKQIRVAQDQIRRRLRRKVDLTNAEMVVANNLVGPDDVTVSLTDIGGLQSIIHRLYGDVVRPLQRPELFRSTLLKPPRGILLYGKPGNGKTMLAKALAKESGAAFINIQASMLQSKWYGESQKAVAAVFSLAEKLQPAIIFVDEVDGLLGVRRVQDHDATLSIKTEFMQHWDGLLTDSDASVVVLGATNRRSELDDAVLRRFSVQIEVPVPGVAQRRDVLRVTLERFRSECGHETPLSAELLASVSSRASDPPGGVESDPDPLWQIARRTQGLTGSDLVQLCSEAARQPMREAMNALDAAAGSREETSVRPLEFRDFMHVLDIDGFSSATAPAAEDQRVLSLADLFQTLQFAAAAAGASGGMPSAPAV